MKESSITKEGKVKVQKKIKVVSLNDWHIPFEDPKVVSLMIAWCKAEQPEIIVMHELHDFYLLSRFDKDPERKFTIQDEIDGVNRYMAQLRKACPKARMILLNSNHLARLKKYIWREAEGLAGLRALNIEALLELKKFNIEFKENFTFKGVLFKHGDIVRKYSSYTAKGEHEREQVSGVSGHTHRLGMHFHTTRGGSNVWMEAGCGCLLTPEYISGIPDWQNGFAVFCFEERGNHFYPTIVPIINHQLFWGNKTFDGR
jgi:hypothetical protein